MFRTFITLIVVSCCFLLKAQDIKAPKGCGYDHYVHHLNQKYPGFHAAAQIKANPLSLRSPDNLDVYTIPVVVHIVWGSEEQNIPDSLIYDVMDVLNEDYRRLNADADLIRDTFVDVVGDPFIEFELAGIERVQTDTTFSLSIFGAGLPDNVKTSEGGGSDAWDTEKYLNIWVCNIEGGSLLGYAYPPANLENWPEDASAPSPELDGVVVHYEVFRRTGSYTASGLLGLGERTIPVRGRTVTHEVGHYLGLRHIWGDGLLSIIGLPDCNSDDGVADTPNQGSSSQFSCDPEQNSCDDDEDIQMPDMFENFMDYSSEDCLNSFTNGQIAIMRSVLENERSGLIEGLSTSTVAIADTENFKVYPNPANNELFVETHDLKADHYQLQLFDMQGRILRSMISQHTNNMIQSVDISSLPTGLYGLRINVQGKRYYQKVMIN